MRLFFSYFLTEDYKQMQITIRKQIVKEEVIDVEFPYYYNMDYLPDGYDCTIYGKIEENKQTSIQISKDYTWEDKVNIEIEVENIHASCASYLFDDEYKGTEYEYLKAKEQALLIINGA